MTTQLHLVPFDEDVLYLVDHEGQPYVPLRPINDALGLDWNSQIIKVKERKFNCRDIPTVAADGKRREMLCLPLRKLPAWLYSISPAKVREDIRPKLERYQEECDEVLWKYWSEGVAVNPRAVVPPAKDFPHHAADRLVAAGRIFREALRSAKALGLPMHEAVRKANEATHRHTGLDVLGELGVEAPQPPPAPPMDADPSDPGAFLRQWMAGKLPVPYCICRSVDLYQAYELWCLKQEALPRDIKALARAVRSIDYRMMRRIQVRQNDGRRKLWRLVAPMEVLALARNTPLGHLARVDVPRFAAALEDWKARERPVGVA